ncbi:MAG: DUF2961 domain-containing protein [Planctomycetes bacterium]|nr:DUF2961 domain-containing protein [Planctomycetota bacterium]
MFDSLTQMNNIETRWFSPENWLGEKGQAAHERDGRKGSPCFPLPAGEQKCLAQYEGGSGCVRRIWLTIDQRTPQTMRGLRIQFFWDGADKAAIDAPLADFFGQGLGRAFTFESALQSNPEGRSFNCCIPMPFKKGMRIELINESGEDLAMCFYDVNITINDVVDEDTLYLHALWRRQQSTVMQEDYEFLPKLNGRGRFLGVNVGVIANTEKYLRTWWGEGECKIFIDGDEILPTLCGTGTEDYIGTAWGQGQYDNLYQGCPLADGDNLQYVFYRWHIPDPIFFQKDIRICMHQIGHSSVEMLEAFQKKGQVIYDTIGSKDKIDFAKRIEMNEGTLFEREADDWSSCAYVYLDSATNDFPALAPVAERTVGLHISEESKRLDQ